MKYKISVVLTACLLLLISNANAGVVNPDCTAEKAAKSAATKAVVGVGGRCDPKEAAKDTVGLDDKDGVLDRDDKNGVLDRDDKKKKDKKKDKDKKKR